jgi:hypothetical protein
VKGGFLFGMGEDDSREENVGTTVLSTTNNGIFKLKWDQNPFDSPIGIDQNFSTLQTVLTTPLYEKEINGELPNDTQKTKRNTLKPKDFSVLKLQEFGGMENGQIEFPRGPLKIRLRWSPEMLTAGAIYALLKIQNNKRDIPEPPNINEIKKILYRIDDPSYIFKFSVRTSIEFQWILQQAKALGLAFWDYREYTKYAPDTPIEYYFEHFEIVKSLKNFTNDNRANKVATDILREFKRHRFPMAPIHMLQVLKSRLLKELRNSGDKLDVIRYVCTIIPGSTGSNLGNSNFRMNCIKEIF